MAALSQAREAAGLSQRELAKKLDVVVEQREKTVDEKIKREELIERILNFKASGPSSFGDAAEWQRNEREDRNLPFSK